LESELKVLKYDQEMRGQEDQKQFKKWKLEEETSHHLGLMVDCETTW